jgi:DNA-binding NtrC family response regulator
MRTETASGAAGRIGSRSRGGTRLGAVPVVLVVDDDPGIRTMLEIALRAQGYRAESAADVPGAARLAATLKPTLVLLDIRLRDAVGTDLLPVLPDRDRTMVVLMTASQDIRELDPSIQAEAVIAKPFDLQDLYRLARESVEARPRA